MKPQHMVYNDGNADRKQLPIQRDGTMFEKKDTNTTRTYIQALFDYIDKTDYGNEDHAASLRGTKVKTTATLAKRKNVVKPV